MFIACFALTTLVHTFQLFRTKTWFMIPFVVGGSCTSPLLSFPRSPSSVLLAHLTLAGDVPRPDAGGLATIRLNSPIRVGDDSLEDFAKVVREWSGNIGRQELRTAIDVENLANGLVETLSNAIKATGRRGSPQLKQSAPWWTDECREAKSS